MRLTLRRYPNNCLRPSTALSAPKNGLPSSATPEVSEVADVEPVGSLSDALESAMAALPAATPVDAAARALARRYACDIDEAPTIALEAQRVLEGLTRHRQGAVDPVLLDRLARLFTRIEQTAVLGVLGPKLNQILTDLEMTPKARRAVGKAAPALSDGAGATKEVKQDDDFTRIRKQRIAAREHAP